ncbi:nestin [Genypterus blacodes]|uniref:nestin n=1 Tax=Genypterus blacodes TaxID=154954 RepID=UPI003F76F4DF
MELHTHKGFHHRQQQEDERSQMLSLNRRLESYLGRVKLLEGENQLLGQEIQALRCSSHGALSSRKGLEEDLQQARVELDKTWRERTKTELEVCRLSEELQALDLQRQREAQAQMEAKMKLEQSRKELGEEQRAQMWLREKVNQMEYEMKLLIQTHQEDVAHMEETLSRSRAAVTSTWAPNRGQTLNLQELGHEYSQRATRARQEAAEAHQAQFALLEESLNQARDRLAQVGQEKKESLLKLQALEKELSSAQNISLHLEKTAEQQRDRHGQEVHELQEHLQGLEEEREELGQQIQRIVTENRSLLQLKLSLGLEVSTYRALLDSERLRGDVPAANQTRSICITDAAFSPRGFKENHHSQLTTRHKTSPLSAVYATKRRSTSAAFTPTSDWKRNPVTISETPKISHRHVEDHSDEESAKTTKYTMWASPYPKVLQSGAVENFRPQEVQEKVTYAEPLSPPNEEEDKEGEVDWNNGGVGPPEEEVLQESVVSCQLKSSLPLHDEVKHFTPYHVRMTEEACGFPDEPDKDVSAEEEEKEEPHAPIEAWLEEEFMGNVGENVPEETSDSETDAVLEPTCESRTSTPASDPEESFFNHEEDGSQDGVVAGDDAEITNAQGTKCAEVVGVEGELKDNLYPDGEEMDTWDSVIERKADLKEEEKMKNNVEKGQHAEPEEDISVREHSQRRARQEVTDTVQQENTLTSVIDTHLHDDAQNADTDKEQSPERDEEDNDDDEDSQNVSVSWRTELESDSYAQDNTLADTRPLIRYKSDETDVNPQVSQRDESESSEGEEDQKAGETGSGAWYGSKSRRSGTMEDLCEEADGESLDEDFEPGYTHDQDRDVGHFLGKDRESGEEMINEEQSEEETEELPEPVEHSLHTDPDLNEELDTDWLVERELENLSTYSYSAHFAQKKLMESEEALNLQEKFVEEMTEEEEEPEVLMSTSKIEEEADYNVSVVTHTDVTEGQELINRPESQNIMDQSSTVHGTADSDDLQDVVKMEAGSMEALSASEEHPMEEVPCSQVFPEFPEAAEWEVLRDITAQNEDDHMYDEVTESLQSFHDDGGAGQAAEVSTDSVPDGAEIFQVKNSTESFKTTSKDNDLPRLLSSGINHDLWLSSLDTGATYQPDDACDQAAERANQNLGISDSLAWGDLENPNVVNGNSRMDIDSSKASVTKKEQEQMEVKPARGRDGVQGERVHSEGSEDEGEIWSSGEEKIHKKATWSEVSD